MIILNNRYITSPSEMRDLSFSEREELIELDRSGIISFKIPDDTSTIKNIAPLISVSKRIYKSGFLNDMYLLLYPDKKKADIFEIISRKYDVFVLWRQFQRDVQYYNDKKNYIFVE